MNNQPTLLYSVSVLKELGDMDKELSYRITSKIEKYSFGYNPLCYARQLKGELLGKYRYRIGDYRAIFTYLKTEKEYIIRITKIAHRKDVYE